MATIIHLKSLDKNLSNIRPYESKESILERLSTYN